MVNVKKSLKASSKSSSKNGVPSSSTDAAKPHLVKKRVKKGLAKKATEDAEKKDAEDEDVDMEQAAERIPGKSEGNDNEDCGVVLEEIQRFSDLPNMPQWLLDGLGHMNLLYPTTIQKLAIARGMQGIRF